MTHPVARLAATIDARRGADPQTSWTAQLLAKGPETCARKFGEEAVEAVIEAVRGDRDRLVSEAAHIMPPIGAQGLNMSLADLTALLDLAQADPAGLGTTRMLDAYHRRRHLVDQRRPRHGESPGSRPGQGVDGRLPAGPGDAGAAHCTGAPCGDAGPAAAARGGILRIGIPR